MAILKTSLVPIEIPRSSMIDELTEKQYQRYLKSLAVSCHDVLQTSIDEAYAIGFMAGQQVLVEQGKPSPAQMALHF